MGFLKPSAEGHSSCLAPGLLDGSHWGKAVPCPEDAPTGQWTDPWGGTEASCR